jgi:hypothetical protein
MHNQLSIFILGAKDYMLPCLNKQLFGIDCPGCGLQRSVLLLFKGEFVAAFQMYPAIYTLIPLLGIVILNKLFNLRYGSQFIIGLGISSVLLIIINFIFKIVN